MEKNGSILIFIIPSPNLIYFDQRETGSLHLVFQEYMVVSLSWYTPFILLLLLKESADLGGKG